MTADFIILSIKSTVADALEHIRTVAPNKEALYTCYITDDSQRLIGFVPTLDLLTAPLDKTVEELTKFDVISVSVDTSREESAKTLARHDLLTLPVVDGKNRLVGIITIDDAIDVLKEENEEDFSVMAAITPGETAYLKTPVFSIFKSRIPWLMLLMFTATFTGMIISAFESALASKVVLTVFIPMLMGTGGNCGSQSSITVIRSLSLGEISFADTFCVLIKEFRVSLLCGICLAVFEFIKIMTLDRILFGDSITLWIAITVSLTLVATVLFAKLVGALLPLAASKTGLDPAVMASPFITTLVDTASLLMYFSAAKAVLGI